MILFDFEKNRIGLAEKVNNFGASILHRKAEIIDKDKSGKDEKDHDKDSSE